MIVYECEQGTEEWLQLRLGIPTASRFDKILTAKKLEFSKQSAGLMDELITEWLTKEPFDTGKSQFMERGNELESEALAEYELEKGTPVRRVGFVTTDDGRVGCSPDALVGCEGGVEVKSMGMKGQVAAALGRNNVNEYTLQIQGCMWICEAQWWDRIYYHPTQPSIIEKVWRDQDIIDRIEEAVATFNEKMDMAREELLQKGWTPKPDPCPPCKATIDDGRWCMSRNRTEKINGIHMCETHRRLLNV